MSMISLDERGRNLLFVLPTWRQFQFPFIHFVLFLLYFFPMSDKSNKSTKPKNVLSLINPGHSRLVLFFGWYDSNRRYIERYVTPFFHEKNNVIAIWVHTRFF